MASSPSEPSHGVGAAMMSAGAVCCMCGDRGLQDELFRCRCCRARLQHRYCSDLYPRAAAYRRCNWCLRAPPGPDQRGRAAAAVTAANDKPEGEKRKTTASASAADEERRRQRHEGCSPRSSRSLPAELGHQKTPRQAAAAAAADNSKAEEKRKTTASASSDEERLQRHEGCSPKMSLSSSSPAELGGHPVKKKHRTEEKTTTPPQRPAAAAGKKDIACTAGAGDASKDEAEVMRAGKAAPRVNNRVRVRRYKLLTEVISC